MLKIMCIAIIIQKVAQVLNLLTLMSENSRSKYTELVEEYPLTREGDKWFTGEAFGIILQYCAGITMFMVAFCLEHK